LRAPGLNQTRWLTALIDNLRRSDSNLKTLSMTNLSFTDMEDDDTLFVDLINIVGPSLRHLELSTADDFHGETGIIASILNDATTQLPQLRSVKLFMNGESCVRTLHKLLSASVPITSANTNPVSFVFWTYDHMIRDDETGDVNFDAGDSLGSSDDDETPITPEEIRNMVSILRNELLSMKIIVLPDSIYYGSTEDEDADPDVALDMTEDIIEALGFLVDDSE
jgi:hypothetical protein